MIFVTRDPVDPADWLARFATGRDDVGAVVSLTGRVRGHGAGGPIHTLTLQAYPGFTESTMRAVDDDARARFDILDTLAVHRWGEMTPGETIVLVAVAAVHRREAFRAADYLMDRLKVDAGFWKCETGPGGRRWIEPRPQDHDDLLRWTAP